MASLGLPQAMARPSSITIGYVPGEGITDLKSRGEEIGKFIERRTGMKVNTYVGAGYNDLVQKMNDKKVDFAFLSVLAFVEVEEKTGLKVLLKKVWEQGFYYSVWLSKKSSPLRKPDDLKGKGILIVDEKSASGYLYPQMSFLNSGLDIKKDFKSVVFSGGHDKSAELLKKGEADAIAVFANDKLAKHSAWSHAGGRLQDVRVLWSSEAIPNDPFFLRNDFYERYLKATHDLMFELIEMNEDLTLGPELNGCSA